MAKSKRLTVTGVERVRPPAKGRDEHFDSVVPGLVLRITENGHKSWSVYYRHNKKHQRLTLGAYPAVGLDAARSRAGEIRSMVAEGTNPKFRLKEKQVERKKVEDSSIEAIGRQFIEEYCQPRLKPGTAKEYRRHIEKYAIPLWGSRPIVSVEKGEIVALLRHIGKNAPVMANRVRATLHKFFDWAEEADLVPANPVSKAKRLIKESDIARDRVLTDAEIYSIWAGLDRLGWPFGAIGKLLLLTGQRVGEVTGMEWSELNLEAAVWSLPKGRTKNKRPHEIPLSSQVVDMLENLPHLHDRFVFPASGSRKAIATASGFSKAKIRLDKLSGVTDWRWHDARRTVATMMAENLGIDPHVIEAVLNHISGSKGGVAGIYNRALYTDRKSLALQAWANRLDEVVKGPDGNVVTLHG